MKVFLAGGGTSGHIHPAVAIADELKKQDPSAEVLFCGTEKGLEAQIIPKMGYPFKVIRAAQLPMKISKKTFKAVKEFLAGRKMCRKLLRENRPDVVVGTGGFVCSPLIAAAHKEKVPILLHEQNAFPGRSNRMMSKYAGTVCTSFPNLDHYFNKKAKIVFTGNPIRGVFSTVDRDACRTKLGLTINDTLILAMGGSLGARTVNSAIVELAKAITDPNVKIILSVGKQRYKEVMEEAKNWPKSIEVFEYIQDPETYLAACDLFIGRAGAITCAEVQAVGAPSVLIPYPYAAQDHQTYNAKTFEDAKAGILLPDDQAVEKLPGIVTELLADKERLTNMRKNARELAIYDAASRIVDEVKALAR
ncbi:MAG: undecaprenyldiphospho-muramoylpentapeptide beta-N-acetylglucosaminyltransferase [Clostridiales bacterium]|nr:undecaprenyldiphospho-muramoylpentapeptide beta-N-acetylglucosaminyltransferase [Clostridiales bacterium]MBR6254418.1 undecaprenyldiphospho-muramoylpentapeptide beta-N-acetylglucosaminyltransferase [Clostridiales bacterium]MCR5274314.1 undecaprenyldiphospho-muramoylpentapeptide beta-N-acetylglucosaminyltransferase [Clostridiales bacterium]